MIFLWIYLLIGSITAIFDDGVDENDPVAFIVLYVSFIILLWPLWTFFSIIQK